ncbi:hypothetical protein AB5I41_16495 [Sphingomonas sp. MMS24-JH45]
MLLRIRQDRVPIVMIAGRLTVEGLSPADAALLASPSFKALINKTRPYRDMAGG